MKFLVLLVEPNNVPRLAEDFYFGFSWPILGFKVVLLLYRSPLGKKLEAAVTELNDQFWGIGKVLGRSLHKASSRWIY